MNNAYWTHQPPPGTYTTRHTVSNACNTHGNILQLTQLLAQSEGAEPQGAITRYLPQAPLHYGEGALEMLRLLLKPSRTDQDRADRADGSNRQDRCPSHRIGRPNSRTDRDRSERAHGSDRCPSQRPARAHTRTDQHRSDRSDGSDRLDRCPSHRSDTSYREYGLDRLDRCPSHDLL